MNPEGVAHFNSQLAYQNPKQDSDPALCKSMSKDQEISLKCLYMNLLEARGTGFIKISDSNENVSFFVPVSFYPAPKLSLRSKAFWTQQVMLHGPIYV